MGVRKWLESAARIGTSWIPFVGTAVDEGLKSWEDHRNDKAARATLLDIEDQQWRPDSSPAALLRADFGVVPFHRQGRQQELENLSEWCEGTGDSRKLPSGATPPVALRLYTAPGGYGKTRLLRHFARWRRRVGWEAGFLGEGKLAEVGGAKGLAGGTVALFGEETKQLLLILDYAESRREEVEAVVAAARESRRALVRLVLLARSDGDWWDQLHRAGDGVGDFFQGPAVEGPLPLAPLTNSPKARQEVFEKAVAAFAEQLGKPAPDARMPLDGEDFDRVLMIHAAALAAVEGEAVHTGGLLDWLLSREERGLDRVRDKHSELGKDLQPALAQAAALLTLAQGADSRSATMEVLDRVPDLEDQSRARRNQVAEALHVLYRGRRWCDGVEPDLVGEHLVRRELEAAPTLLAAAFGPEVPEAHLENGLLVLNLLAQRQPETRSLLRQALRGHLPRLALPAVKTAIAYGDPIGQVLAEALEEPGGDEVAAQLEVHLPYTTTALRETGAVVARLQLERFRRQMAEEPSEQQLWELAKLANILSIRLADLGQYEDALAVGQEAVDIFGELAEGRPDEVLADLATSLNNLSICLGDLGRRENALAASGEAVDIQRRLAEQRPDEFLPNLPKFLINLSNYLAQLERREDALAVSQEAVDIQRRLTALTPHAFLPHLAAGLNSLSNRLAQLERHEDALTSCRAVVDIYRQASEGQPDAFLPDLAGSLSNLSILLAGSGRSEDGLAAIQESVCIYRQLAEQRPNTFLPDLARSLSILHSRLAGEDQPAALVAIREALDHLEPFFRRYPPAFAPLMTAIIQDYERSAEACGEAPDRPRLEAIREILQQVQEGE